MISIMTKKFGLLSLATLILTTLSLQSTSFKPYTMQPIYSDGDPITHNQQPTNHYSAHQNMQQKTAIRVAVPQHSYPTKNNLVHSHSATKTNIAPQPHHTASHSQKLKIISRSTAGQNKVATQNPVTIIPNYISYNQNFSRSYFASVNTGIAPQPEQQAIAYRSRIPLNEGRKMLKPVYYYAD